jgi:hypothetical protein
MLFIWLVLAIISSRNDLAIALDWDPVNYEAFVRLDDSPDQLKLALECNGVQFEGEINTGLAQTVLDISLKEHVGEYLGKTDFGEPENITQVARHKCANLMFAGLPAPISEVLLMDLRTGENALKVAGKAMIGLDILRQFVLYVDNDRRVIYFTNRVENPNALGERLPLTFAGDGTPRAPVMLGSDHKTTLGITTFSKVSVTVPFHEFREATRERAIRPFGRVASFSSFGGNAKIVEVGEAVLNVGSQTVFDVEVHPQGAGAMGMRILNRFAWVLDYPGKTLYLRPGKLLRAKDYWDGGGVIFDPDAKVATVYQVYPGSIAEKSGLQKGDVFDNVDGKPQGIARPIEVFHKLRALRTEPLAVTVIRDGQRQNITLPP